MDPLLAAAVVISVMTWRMTSADDQSCEIHPPFKTKERSAEFLAKSSWIDQGGLLSTGESVFVRRRHCPMRVRVEEEGSKEMSPGNGSHSKEVGIKKAGNSQRKLKGSKRKRKKEKRKRFRKRKKKKSSMKIKKTR